MAEEEDINQTEHIREVTGVAFTEVPNSFLGSIKKVLRPGFKFVWTMAKVRGF